MIVSDGRPLGNPKDPPGQRSVYIIPGNTKRETYRLMTFDKYPQGAAVDPWTLVRAGFYYKGYKDRVQCHSCGMQVQDWTLGDNPRDAKWHEIGCRFEVHNPEENDAISAIRDPITAMGPQVPTDRPAPPARRVLWRSPEVTVLHPNANPAGRVLTAANRSSAEVTNRDNLRIMYPCDNPYSPHLTSFQSRLQTFVDRARNWSQVRIKATPTQMAEAGLYYLGERDRVKCYYCNGGLQNWALNDDPWFEHAKWFPLCEYLLQNKGPEYVERITNIYAHLQRPRGRGARPPLGRVPSSLDINPNEEFLMEIGELYPGTHVPWEPLTDTHRPRECVDRPIIIDPGEERQKKQEQIDKEMGNSEVIQAAFELGFERYQIRRALSIRLDECGRGFGKVETLVTYLLDEQNQGKLEMGRDHAKSAEPLSEESEITKVKRLLAEDKCRVCRQEKARILLLPCGHLVVCEKCGIAVSYCPVCHTKVASRTVVFRV